VIPCHVVILHHSDAGICHALASQFFSLVGTFVTTQQIHAHWRRRSNSVIRSGYLIWYENIGGDNPVAEKMRSNHATYRQDVARWIGEGIEDGEVHDSIAPDAFGHFFCSWVFGIIFQWFAEPEAVNLDETFTFARGLQSSLLRKGI